MTADVALTDEWSGALEVLRIFYRANGFRVHDDGRVTRGNSLVATVDLESLTYKDGKLEASVTLVQPIHYLEINLEV